MRIAHFICVGLIVSSTGYAGEQSASASGIAEMMKQAKYSEGFEARLNVLVTKANGAHLAPFKLAVIGQFSASRQRLVIRGISPEAVRNHFYAAERDSNARIKAMESLNQSASDYAEFDPYAKLFNSGLVVWDMFGPWWSWPVQSLDGIERINGRDCTKIRSFAEDKNSAVQEVESCVDQPAKLSLRTRMYDGTRVLLRTTVATQFAHKGNAGAMVAKKLNITDASNMLTDIEVYAGDEQYEISAKTFAMLDHPARSQQPETK
jgi:hypothetical protein